MSKGRFVVKFIIFVVAVVCGGFAINHLVKIEKWLEEPSNLVAPDLTHNASEPIDNSTELLDSASEQLDSASGQLDNASEQLDSASEQLDSASEQLDSASEQLDSATAPLSFKDVDQALNDHYIKCILKPSKPFCLLSSNKRLEMFKSDNPMESPDVEVIESRIENVTADLQRAESDVSLFIADFLNLMSSFKVQAFVVEPSILFCLLPSFKRLALLQTGLNPGRVQGSRNIVTFGVFEEALKNLNEVNTTTGLLSAGFKITKLRKWRENQSPNQYETGRFEPVHYFFIRHQVAAHVVVFEQRASYLRHARLNPEDIDLDGLLFADEGIYENFSLRSIDGPRTENVSIHQLFIPSHMRYFLKETVTSRFLGCREPTRSDSELTHPSLTAEQVAVSLALREIKTILAPSMATFWLWSRSLLGWSNHCNVLHYAPSLELALELRGTLQLNLTAVFAESDFLRIRNDLPASDSELHLVGRGLRVNFTIFHDERTEPTADKKYEQRLQYPELFQLCSTDVFGQKVNVPCTADLEPYS